MIEDILELAKLRKVVIGKLTPAEIKSIRRKFSLTQVAFSDLIGVKYNTYRSWEGGYKYPSSPSVALLHIAKNYPSTFIKNIQNLTEFVKANY